MRGKTKPRSDTKRPAALGWDGGEPRGSQPPTGPPSALGVRQGEGAALGLLAPAAGWHLGRSVLLLSSTWRGLDHCCCGS